MQRVALRTKNRSHLRGLAGVVAVPGMVGYEVPSG
jgi:hypothetical protein